MAKTTESGASGHAAGVLSELSGWPVVDCSGLVQALEARSPRVQWIQGLGPLLAFFAWMVIFGRATDALEGTRWDVLGFLEEQGPLGFLAVILLGFGVAVTLAVLVGTVIPRALLRRQVRYHLYSPACFWCGYSQRGLEISNDSICCPECGRRSPVRRPAMKQPAGPLRGPPDGRAWT